MVQHQVVDHTSARNICPFLTEGWHTVEAVVGMQLVNEDQSGADSVCVYDGEVKGCGMVNM